METIAGGAFFRGLVARDPAGNMLVTSDAHARLVAAIGATQPDASWRRCRTYDAVNPMSNAPRASWPCVKLPHSVYDQPDASDVQEPYDRFWTPLSDKPPAVAEHLDEARTDVLAFSAVPKDIWSQT